MKFLQQASSAAWKRTFFTSDKQGDQVHTRNKSEMLEKSCSCFVFQACSLSSKPSATLWVRTLPPLMQQSSILIAMNTKQFDNCVVCKQRRRVHTARSPFRSPPGSGTQFYQLYHRVPWAAFYHARNQTCRRGLYLCGGHHYWGNSLVSGPNPHPGNDAHQYLSRFISRAGRARRAQNHAGLKRTSRSRIVRLVAPIHLRIHHLNGGLWGNQKKEGVAESSLMAVDDCFCARLSLWPKQEVCKWMCEGCSLSFRSSAGNKTTKIHRSSDFALATKHS